ncbi:hypothetical protein [Streptomyces sp. NPDC050255]|uniref:hypothetical protein n=1 Tax=Streptomyces sp. NPDC050255 TaxID=3365606 RepID=UPI003793A9EC
MSTATLAVFTEPDRPKNLLTRFITVGGSYVNVTSRSQHPDKNRWTCHGCGDSSPGPRRATCPASGRTPTATPPPATPSGEVTARHVRGALLLAAAVPLAAATAAAVLKAGHWLLYDDRHRIEIKPQPRSSCPDCRGAGGWWVGGANPEMEACGCCSERSELRVRLWLVPAWPDNEPPF